MRKLLLIMLLSLSAIAANLQFSGGQISVHTEVFGDSKINPTTNKIQSSLTQIGGIESIKGKIYFNYKSLISSSQGRDEHMYELIDTSKFPKLSFLITQVTKNANHYMITGILTINNVSKEITSTANILDDIQNLQINGSFSINMTSFNITPPIMVFLTVRDQLDIKYALSYTKGE